MSQRSSSVAGAAALGLAFGGFAAAEAFVPGIGATSPSTTDLGRSALRGHVAGAGVGSVQESGNPSNLAAVGLAGAAAATALLRSGAEKRRTARRAEPLSAAAKGATKAVSAVAGSAGTSSLAQTAEENKDDSELAEKKLYKKDVGTPEYEAIKAAQQKQNEKAWEYQTVRNADGNFGDSRAAYKGKADMYDPLDSLSERWLQEAGQDFNPAFQIGATEPLGYFDPAGFCKRGDEKSFRQYRTAEIKHGRVAMMAALGAVVQHFVKFPGFENVPSGLAAVNSAPGSFGAIILFAIAGGLELGVWTEQEDKAPGNFGDPLGLSNYSEDMRNRELNNGRAAMFAAIGIIAAELLSGKDAVEQLGL